MTVLRARPDFNPLLVNWGGPEEPRTDRCSYCGDPFPDSDEFIPLILSRDDGWVAEFCEHCQAAWFGVETFPDPPDDERRQYDVPYLGPCCLCGTTIASALVMLDRRAAVPGHGWGCDLTKAEKNIPKNIPPDPAAIAEAEERGFKRGFGEASEAHRRADETLGRMTASVSAFHEEVQKLSKELLAHATSYRPPVRPRTEPHRASHANCIPVSSLSPLAVMLISPARSFKFFNRSRCGEHSGMIARRERWWPQPPNTGQDREISTICSVRSKQWARSISRNQDTFLCALKIFPSLLARKHADCCCQN